MSPPLSDAPLLPWYCPDCVSAGSFGFEEGDLYDLVSYESVANQFKHSWFATHAPKWTQKSCPYHAMHESSSSSATQTPTGPCKCPIPASAIVQQYWSIVESGQHANPVTVEYGSDLDTSDAGSGFPTSGNYARSGWNLNNLPQLSRSLLKHLTNISGVTIPWLYVGMLFSSK